MKKERHITLDIEKLPEGYYVATSRDVQGLVAQAKTFEKVIEIAEDVAKKLIRMQNNKSGERRRSGRIIYPMIVSA